ncbi:MAG: substrate-binding domain-containing protein [Bacteroidota bacterium]
MKLAHYSIAFAALSLLACSSPTPATKETKKPVVYLEESFKPLFVSSIETYHSQNNMGEVTAEYAPEGKVIEALMNRTTETICITRELNKEELATLKKRNIEVRSEKMAKDAVALIINVDNQDSLITIAELKDILLGKTTTWKTSKSPINIVFDNENSANFNYLKNLAGFESIPANVYAVNSNEEVIEHVKKNKSTIGIIGVNWISDEDDPQALSFRKGLKVVSVAQNADENYYKPYQSYIYTDEYPLTRDVFLITYASRTSPNSGFTNFMVGEKGQLIIQKSSLIPAKMRARMIEISTE